MSEAEQKTGVPLPPQTEVQPKAQAASKPVQLPPTPPDTDSDSDDSKSTTSTAPTELNVPMPPPSHPQQVLDVDKSTPDTHVPRDPRLIRLTGAHPFNAEAPLSDLYNEGFLTSPDLFYVRNHGAVPEVQDSERLDWEFSVEGLVQNPLKITLRELLQEYENVTYPITLVCAGNRRKEQNVVRKSKGFSWGPAGVSTALFTGVVMRDVIERAKPLRKAKYVCMEGADELPGDPKKTQPEYYGTSVKLNWVMDPNRGIMLAHKMNGEPLTPDHGKPLRAVIPGQIGGRSVKWIKKLIVSAEPSHNWYHIHDNRVLPTMVDLDESTKNPKWWMDERYAIYDLSPNAAIAFPAHEEKFGIASAPEEYTIRGYAYSGGGRRVTRCEVSLDKGKTWRLANIDYAEDRYRAYEDKNLFDGRLSMDWRETCFCWCFWNLDIATAELAVASDILVRAMDEAMCIMPRDMYWSVLGMMNNPWYRIAIHNDHGSLRFEHPTRPGFLPGGWMERIKKAGGNLTNGYWGEAIADGEPEEVKEIKMTKDGVNKTIELDELRAHSKPEEPWFVVNGEVYNGTPFLKGHPGGAQAILGVAALDATATFMGIHSDHAKEMMPDYHIGTLSASARKTLESGGPTTEPSKPRPVFLDSHVWSKALLHSKKSVSWDTRLFTFKLDYDEQALGLPTGHHLMICLRDPVTRKSITRPYTPISETGKKGYVDVLIKIYNDVPASQGKPAKIGGKMTKALDAIPMGYWVDMMGPIGKFEYLSKGACRIDGNPRSVKKFIMICGGSGITPIFQVLRAVMQDKEDPTTCTLLDGNRLVEDILLKEDLDRFQRENEDRCEILYTLTQGPEDWQGSRGRIAGPLLEKHCHKGKAGDTMVLVCGPPSFVESVKSWLLGSGWAQEDLLFF
ncbi:hypothetical protein PQX77_000090 [Marasmius sp. AFHP31]|nr:hypothetical protein PQX77_000090 [Marasmius sp. AFHP31]